MNSEELIAIHVEAIEVMLNHILYIRGVYPAQIFKKRRVYNTPVFITCFPTLNNYITNVLRTVRSLLESQLKLKLEMLIYQTDSENIVNKERYFFELQAPATSGTFNSDRYLNEYEQELSAALYKLAERVKTLPALGSQTKFKLHIHTTQSSFTQLNQDGQQQEFPWMITTTETKHNAKLLPLVNIESLGLKMEAHIVS